MSSIPGRIVQSLRVVRDALVPDEDCSGLIAHSALEVLTLGDVVEEELQEVVGLLLVESDNLFSVDGVYI